MRQRYVSNELTHFAGKGLSDEGAQFDLLVKILRDGWLLAGGSSGRASEQFFEFRVHHEKRLSENALVNPAVVCFCDIPGADLAIHIEKYSPFGLAFPKAFLHRKGAAPVYYIPLGPRFGGRTGADVFNKVGELFLKHVWVPPDSQTNPQELGPLFSIFQNHVLSFLKFFDESKADEDPGNFYMEREWRTMTSVSFTLDDVARVILPKRFAARFRQHVPTYIGEVTFVD